MVKYSDKDAIQVPKKNLIPPFTSKKWSFLSIFKVKGDYVLSGNFTSVYSSTNVKIENLKSNTMYRIGGDYDTSKQRVRVGRGSNNAIISANPTDGSGSSAYIFTVPADENSIQVTLDNNTVNGNTVGYLEWSNLWLYEDLSSLTFEPYEEVNRSASRIPKKNLLFTTVNKWEQGTVNGSTGQPYAPSNDSTRIRMVGGLRPISPNTTYTIRVSEGYEINLVHYNSNSIVINGITYGGGVRTFTTPNNACYMVVILRKVDSTSNITPNEVIYAYPQLERGSIVTPFEQYIEVNRVDIPSSIIKFPYKNYPFDFKRDNSSIFEAKKFGINQPRISSDGGIVVEEGTINLLDSVSLVPNGMSFTEDSSIVYKGFNMSKVERTLTTGTQYYGFKMPTTAGKQYYLSCIVYDPFNKFDRITFYDSGNVNNELTGNHLSKKTSLGNDYYLIESRITATTTSTPSHGWLIYLNPSSNGELGDKFWISMLQVEQKAYSTSYVKDERKREYLTVNNGEKYIDSEKGSIEMTLTPLTGDNSTLPQSAYGMHDLVYYTAGFGFLVRRNYNGVGDLNLVSVNDTGSTVNRNTNIKWVNGTPINYRLTWDRTAGFTRLYVNDALTLEMDVVFKVVPNGYPIEIGSRGIGSSIYGSGNAIYKDIVIKDRNGNITYFM